MRLLVVGGGVIGTGPLPEHSLPCALTARPGFPRNLAVLHSPPLRAVAVRYWARIMRSPWASCA